MMRSSSFSTSSNDPFCRHRHGMQTEYHNLPHVLPGADSFQNLDELETANMLQRLQRASHTDNTASANAIGGRDLTLAVNNNTTGIDPFEPTPIERMQEAPPLLLYKNTTNVGTTQQHFHRGFPRTHGQQQTSFQCKHSFSSNSATLSAQPALQMPSRNEDSFTDLVLSLRTLGALPEVGTAQRSLAQLSFLNATSVHSRTPSVGIGATTHNFSWPQQQQQQQQVQAQSVFSGVLQTTNSATGTDHHRPRNSFQLQLEKLAESTVLSQAEPLLKVDSKAALYGNMNQFFHSDALLLQPPSTKANAFFTNEANVRDGDHKMKPSVHKAKLTVSKRRKKPAKPQDPNAALPALSPYNFFFREQRERLLEIAKTLDDDTINDLYGLAANVESDEYTEDQKTALLEKHWYRDRHARRRHRKTHSHIDFTKLSKLISERWRTMSAVGRQFYQDVAARDLERYTRETKAARKQEPAPKPNSDAAVKHDSRVVVVGSTDMDIEPIAVDHVVASSSSTSSRHHPVLHDPSAIVASLQDTAHTNGFLSDVGQSQSI